jgi:hypothetical protein
MRAPLALLALVGAGLGLARPVGAAPTTPKAYADLPLASVPGTPTKPVRWVGAHERTAGFHVTKMPTGGGPTGVEIFASAEDAKAAQSGNMDTLESCFVEIERLTTPGWSTGEARMMIWGGDGDGAKAVRSEKLVESADQEKATLELVDAWVDSRTGGAKVIGKTSVPLVRVGGVLSELRVYAARDEGPKHVHVVVKRAPGARQVSGFPFQVDRATNVTHGACSHAHVVLQATKPSGDFAIVKTAIKLPEIEKSDAHESKAKDDELPNVVTETRVREVEVQLGASQTSSDKTPLFSVSFGWAGREQTATVSLDGSMRLPRGKRFKK